MTNPWVPDDAAWPSLVSLADCLCTQITASGLPEVCFCGVMPGAEVAWDYVDHCKDGDGGMAWTRLRAISPDLSAGQTVCPSPFVISVEMGIVRACPVPDPAEPPPFEEWFATAELQMADKQAMLRAAACCFDKRWNMESYTPVGPQGGVVGGYWFVTISLDN